MEKLSDCLRRLADELDFAELTQDEYIGLLKELRACEQTVLTMVLKALRKE